MSFPTIISHPDHEAGDPHLSLQAHSAAVRRRISPLHRGGPSPARVPRVVGYLHDFGKLTVQFQQYISPDDVYDGPAAERYHAQLGAFVTLYALDELGVGREWAGAGAVAVARHHQSLPNTASYVIGTLVDALGSPPLQSQVESISETWPEVADELLTEATDDRRSWEGFERALDDGTLEALLVDLAGREELTGVYGDRDSIPTSLYDKTLHLWGSLTLADKSHAKPVSRDRIHEFGTLERGPLESHIEGLQAESKPGLTGDLNEYRQDGLEQTLAGVHEWQTRDDPPKVGTITLPTGLGKTFTGIAAALTLRDQFSLDGRQQSVIYALPYTSIIEQTREHFENPNIWNASPREDEFTVHHYLSDTVVEADDEALSEGSFLGESWRSGVVLTTYVQLFESLAGPSNQSSTKLSALDSAVVILDEPQTLPKDWWDGIQRLLDVLTDEFGAWVISMTATQPALVAQLDTISLLDAGAVHTPADCSSCTDSDLLCVNSGVPSRPVQSYFGLSDRVEYEIHPSATAHALDADAQYVSHATAARQILDAAVDEGSALAVCNTIASSRTLTEMLADRDHVHHLGKTYQRLLDRGAVTPRDDPQETAEAVLRECGVSDEDDGQRPEQDDWSALIASFSSRFRPVDRRVLLALVDHLTNTPDSFVLVSTQAVEAGVDVSFAHVFRDIAPIDSIVQAGGRCNRNFEWGRRGGTVTVWTLSDTDESTADGRGTCPAQYIYERGVPGHLRLIADTLADASGRTVPEREMAYDLVRNYFDRLSDGDGGKSVADPAIRTEIDHADAADLGERSLIGGHDTIDVLLPLQSAERTAVRELSARLEAGDYGAAQSKLTALADLRVSLPVENAANVESELTDDDSVELLVGLGDVLEYDTVTGLIGADEARAGATEL